MFPIQNIATIDGDSKTGNLHRVKRGGVYGALGKTLVKIGPTIKTSCIIPLPGYCPLVKALGKVYVKVGLGLKKLGTKFKAIAPKLPFKDPALWG